MWGSNLVIQKAMELHQNLLLCSKLSQFHTFLVPQITAHTVAKQFCALLDLVTCLLRSFDKKCERPVWDLKQPQSQSVGRSMDLLTSPSHNLGGHFMISFIATTRRELLPHCRRWNGGPVELEADLPFIPLFSLVHVVGCHKKSRFEPHCWRNVRGLVQTSVKSTVILHKSMMFARL